MKAWYNKSLHWIFTPLCSVKTSEFNRWMKGDDMTLVIRTLITVALIAILSACAGSPVRTGWIASQHRSAMVRVQPDQTPQEVVLIMGQPDKTELYRGRNDEPILVYLYITEGKDTYSRKWSEANYTPFVFLDQRLKGWGWSFFNGAAQKYEFIIKDLY